MTALLRAELRKLSTLRTTWVLTTLGLGLAVLFTAELLLGAPAADPEITPVARTVTAVATIGNNSIIVLVIALLVMTTEFRHGTVGRTLLTTPSRARVLTAKLATGGIYATGFFAASLAIVVVLATAASDVPGSALLAPEVTRTTWHGLAGLTLTGILGVAVGALIRSQVVAITVALAWLFVIENLAAALHYGSGRWLPFQALHAVFLGDAAESIEPGLIAPLAPGVALVVFLAYVAAATTAAGVRMTVRDV